MGGLGKLSNPRDMRTQKISCFGNPGTRLIEVDAFRNRGSVKLSVDGLDHRRDIVPVLPGNKLSSDEPNEVQQREGRNIGCIAHDRLSCSACSE